MTAQTGIDSFGRIGVAMVNPFDGNGALDVEAGRRLAAHLVEEGVDALILAGTTGESPTTTLDEKLELLRAVKEEVGDKAAIVAGAGTNNTASTIDVVKATEEAGADSLLVVTPYYSKPSQDGVEAHFRAVADATELPICLYDIPGRSGIPIETETIRCLAEVPNIKAVKDAKGDLAAAASLIRETDLAWYSGDDPLNLPWLSLGASGFISVIGHVAPRALAELYTSFAEGDLERARDLHAKTLLPLTRAQGRLGGTTFAKAALRLQGIEVGEPRLPVLGATDDQVEELRHDMEKAGVL